MLNYKIERLLFALLWITLICFFSFAIPPQTVTLLVQYQYTMSSLILTALILYLYTKIRNKRVLNVINRYLTMNEFEKCNLYLEKCIRRQPKVFWLKFQKLMMIALKGEITQFKSYSDIQLHHIPHKTLHLKVFRRMKNGTTIQKLLSSMKS